MKHFYLNHYFGLFRYYVLKKDFLRASGLGLISSRRLDSKRVIKSIKSAWSFVHLELKAHILPPLEGNNKGYKTHTQANKQYDID